MTKGFRVNAVFMYSDNQFRKPRSVGKHLAPPPLQSQRLLDQVRERIRYKHYSIRTEQAYVYWVRCFVRFHRLRHPREMGATEVERFLCWLAAERKVAASTHKQALSAILLLCRYVLGMDLPWLASIGRPTSARRVPTVLSQPEVAVLLLHMEGMTGDRARLIYGTGMRM